MLSEVERDRLADAIMARGISAEKIDDAVDNLLRRMSRDGKTFTSFSESEVPSMDRKAMLKELADEYAVDVSLITDAVPDELLAEWLRSLDSADGADDMDDADLPAEGQGGLRKPDPKTAMADVRRFSSAVFSGPVSSARL